MKTSRSLLVFLVVEIAIALFVVATGTALPEHIATHFNVDGVPNGFMSKSGYLVFMLLFAAGMPAFVVGSVFLALRAAPDRVNIPHRKIWLSPENRQQTIQYLDQRSPWLGSLLCLFLGFVHWSIVNANSVQPVQLSNKLMFAGIGILLAGIVLWFALVMLKFRRLPPA